MGENLRGRVRLGLLPDPLLVGNLVLTMVESRKKRVSTRAKIEKLLSSSHEEVIGIAVGRALGVWVVQEVLNANEDLLDSNSRLPVPVLV